MDASPRRVSHRRLGGRSSSEQQGAIEQLSLLGVAPPSNAAVRSTRRNKRETILKRHFKRKDQAEKQLVHDDSVQLLATPPESFPPRRDEGLVSDTSPVEVISHDRPQKSTESVAPVRKEKVSVARLPKMNYRVNDDTDEHSSTATTGTMPQLLTSSVEELLESNSHVAFSRPRTPDRSVDRHAGLASSVTASLARQNHVGTSVAATRGSRRHDLVMRRLSARRDAGGDAQVERKRAGLEPSRSCSPAVVRRDGGGRSDRSSIHRSNSVERPCAFNMRSIHTDEIYGFPGHKNAALELKSVKEPMNPINLTSLAGQKFSEDGASLPRMHLHSARLPVLLTHLTSLSRPTTADYDSYGKTKSLEVQPVTITSSFSDRTPSSPMRAARRLSKLQSNNRSRAIPLDVKKTNAVSCPTIEIVPVDGPQVTFTSPQIHSTSERYASPACRGTSQPMINLSLTSTSDEKTETNDPEMDFTSGSPHGRGSSNLHSQLSCRNSASATSIYGEGKTRSEHQKAESPAVPTQTVNEQSRMTAIYLYELNEIRVDSPSDIRSSSSTESATHEVTLQLETPTNKLGVQRIPSGGNDPLDGIWEWNNIDIGKFNDSMKQIHASEELRMFDTESSARTELTFQPAELSVDVGDAGEVKSIEKDKKTADTIVIQFTSCIETCDDSRRADETSGEEKQREGAGPLLASSAVGIAESSFSSLKLVKATEGDEPQRNMSQAHPVITSPLRVYITEFANVDDVKSEMSCSEAGLTDILGNYNAATSSLPKRLVTMTHESIPVERDIAISGSSLGCDFPASHISKEEPLKEAENSDVTAHVGDWTPGSPPPPPPPPGTPRNTKKNRRSQHKHQILSSVTRVPGTPVPTPRASGSKKAHFFGEDYVFCPEMRDKMQGLRGVTAQNDQHASNMRKESGTLPRSLTVLSNQIMSLVSSAVMIQDATFAEKVDFAISAAAFKFEGLSEQVYRTEWNKSNRTVASDDVDGGAFSTWKIVTMSGQGEGYNPNEVCGDRDLPMPLDLAPDASTASHGNSTTSSSLQRMSSGDDDRAPHGRRATFPFEHPAPFELALDQAPQFLSAVLSFLGDPVAVCRVKMTSKACCQYVDENEHMLMRDAVRVGGMSMNVRPSFWLWVTLEKSSHLSCGVTSSNPRFGSKGDAHDLEELVRTAREGRWHHVIERDVARAFGNLPPHKTGARLRTDSIVRALVTWGKNRVMKRGLRGSGPPPPASGGNSVASDDVSVAPTDTVSDWGGVTPTASFASSLSGGEAKRDKSNARNRHSRSRLKQSLKGELALSGNALTDDMKEALQDKLSFILHALASAHTDVGYCQGMDYVVAHLLRILQDTVRWNAAAGRLPSVIASASKRFYGQKMSPERRREIYDEIDRSLVVEEACYRVMDSFFSVYSLRHFYWPELRCLKTCCLVFEKLIKIKLPVLADHFEHHELNVGLFALGWFQTLFLYLPSMPSVTVCHMWDIWMVERSFKIFFRVGTAILFLSQPILLNHELEGMMNYLNTFPDATLLSPDILIACALQIKVTNRLLMELEREVTSSTAGRALRPTVKV